MIVSARDGVAAMTPPSAMSTAEAVKICDGICDVPSSDCFAAEWRRQHIDRVSAEAARNKRVCIGLLTIPARRRRAYHCRQLLYMIMSFIFYNK